MTFESVSRAWKRVGKLMFIVALCFCAEMLIYVVQMFVVLGIGRENYGSFGPFATAWRWLAWGPVLVYVAAVVLCFPLPRLRRRDMQRLPSDRSQVPPMGRGMLLFFGGLLFLSVWGHAASLLPEGAPIPGSTVWVVYVMLIAIGALILRIILGTLRLLPRSWRVPPAQAPNDGVIDLPDQRFAPARPTNTDGPR
ncbi:hypothetical protein [Isoptericola sp. BMS4]|uniref:hypothetical protein n=1 Tax=Isoptericola sp. BMS4 TaxID=2527875 RepID=UPI00141DC106|nr:hypothetical protein [Isoptericola sp. BMS4]